MLIKLVAEYGYTSLLERMLSQETDISQCSTDTLLILDARMISDNIADGRK